MYDYDWAFNKLKLNQSVSALMERKKADPSVVIDEKSIKAEYIRRAGKVLEVPVDVKKEVKEEAVPVHESLAHESKDTKTTRHRSSGN